MGILLSAFSLASIIGVPLALVMAGRISWHAPFIFIGILGIIIIPLVSKFMPAMAHHLDPDREHVKPLRLLKNILSNRQQLIALFLSGSLMLGHFLIIPFLNPYMELNVGFNETQRNLVYMVGGIASFVSAPFIGRLADRYGKHKVFYVFAALSLITIFLITNMPAIKYYYVLMVTGIWFAFSTGRTIPAQAIISNVVHPEQRGSFMSFNSSFQQMFTGMASLLAGFVVYQGADNKIHHYDWVGYLSIAVVVIAMLIAKAIHTDPKSDPAVTPIQEEVI